MPLKNEIGNTYGYLTVIERAPNNKEGRAMWKCKCKCVNEVLVLGKYLRSGNTKSCGCYQKERATESNLKRGSDLTGRRFGKLVVIEEDDSVTDSYKNIGWNTKDKFEERQQRDKAKFDFCKENNIKLYYITYKDNIEKKIRGNFK